MAARRAKHVKIREYLLKRIDDGRWKPGTRLPPIRKLVTDLGVSDSTVIKALDTLVQDGRVVRRRGSGTYVSDASTHPHLPNTTSRIGLLLAASAAPSLVRSGYPGAIMRGILDYLEIKEGPRTYNTLPHQATRLTWTAKDHRFVIDALGEPQEFLKHHPPLNAVLDGQYDGLITVGIFHAGWLNDLLRLKIPTVIADFPNDVFLDQADHVIVDPMAGYKEAAQYYLEQGCERLHFVGDMLPDQLDDGLNTSAEVIAAQKGRYHINPDSLLRKAAMELALSERGLSLPARAFHTVRKRVEHIEALCEKLVGLPAAVRPDAVLCHSYEVADTLCSAFSRKRIKLRGAGAATGPTRGRADPIKTSLIDMGRTAASLLISRSQQPGRLTQKVGIPMRFSPGSSSK